MMAHLKRAPLLAVLAGLLLAGFAGLRILAAPPSESGGLNVVAAAGLRETTTIAIDERAQSGGYKSAAVVTDLDVVKKVVATLDTKLPLRRRAQCVERYRLHFILRDGTEQTFGYSCGEWGNFLRGTQEFWQFQDVSPPDAFMKLIAGQIGKASKKNL